MRLQKATRCALFAMIELASDPGRQKSAADIAAKYGVSSNHLAKVLRSLGKANLVEAVRGAGGGYRLKADTSRTTLLDVVKLFETVDPIRQGNAEDGDQTPAGQALNRILGGVEMVGVEKLAQASLEKLAVSLRG